MRLVSKKGLSFFLIPMGSWSEVGESELVEFGGYNHNHSKVIIIVMNINNYGIKSIDYI